MELKIISKLNDIYYFKNISHDIKSGLLKFIFTYDHVSTILYINYDIFNKFLIEISNSKYFVDKDYIDETIADLFENLQFYIFGYNNHIKKFTISNINYLVNKIAHMCLFYSQLYEIKFDKIKKNIKERLYACINDVKDNKHIEIIFKKLWLIFNHLTKYDILKKNNSIYSNLTFRIEDFIFDQL